jgi:hypothetical protein
MGKTLAHPSIAKNNLVFLVIPSLPSMIPIVSKFYRFIALSSKKMIERGDSYDISTQIKELREM